MNAGSRYTRPLDSSDLDTITSAVATTQTAVQNWLDINRVVSTDPAAELLCQAAIDLCAAVTDLVIFHVAPQAAGLHIVK